MTHLMTKGAMRKQLIIIFNALLSIRQAKYPSFAWDVSAFCRQCNSTQRLKIERVGDTAKGTLKSVDAVKEKDLDDRRTFLAGIHFESM